MRSDSEIDFKNIPIPFPTNFKVKNEKKYLVSSSWWRKWCDYTNFIDMEVFDNSIPPSPIQMASSRLNGDITDENAVGADLPPQVLSSIKLKDYEK